MKKVLIIFGAVFLSACMVSSTKAIGEAGRAAGGLSIGDEHLGGIVFHLTTDDSGRQGGYIVSEIETMLPWQDPVSVVGATGTTPGPDNYKMITNSPAKDWIKENFSDEWYLPTLNELMILWMNRYTVLDALEDGSHDPLTLDGYYWSSREYGEGNAYFFNFEDGDPYTSRKSVRNSVRAVKSF